MSDGRYEIAAAVRVGCGPADIAPWLVEPERMARWMLGVDVRAGADGTVIVEASGGTWFGHTFLGTVVEQGPERVVRRYALEEMRGGVARLSPGPAQYERTVTYALPAGEVRCTVVTVIPGLAVAAARAGARAETRSLERSLARLRDVAEGRRPGVLSRLRGGGIGQPL